MGRTRSVIIGENVPDDSKEKESKNPTVSRWPDKRPRSQNPNKLQKTPLEQSSPSSGIVSKQANVQPDTTKDSPTIDPSSKPGEEIDQEQLSQDDNQTSAQDLASEKKIVQPSQVSSKPRVGQTRVRSRRYKSARALVDKTNSYPLEQALELAQKSSTIKFDATIELHVRVVSKKGQEALRGSVSLPSGPPKAPKIRLFEESMVDDIKKGKLEFDVLVARPADMVKLAPLAKVLGPKGLMPSPKDGTLSDNPEAIKKAIQSGKISYKTDPQGIIHFGLAKVSWDKAKIRDNIQAFLKEIPPNRVGSIILTTSMGPGIKLSRDIQTGKTS